jgi:hypothetical protein
VNLRAPVRLALLLSCSGSAAAQEVELRSQGLSGYISMEVPAPPDAFGYGVSLYAAAWPLLEHPLRDFQIGLASIWIVPENRNIEEPLLPTGTLARDHWPERGPSYRDVFQTIEGGLGFWASTRFGSTTAKFRMNGTPDGYDHEISSPGWGFGAVKALAAEERGIAQLSPHLLVPPDGVTFESGTCGELLGYAWMALPLIEAKARTAGLDVPTGDQSWTLFLNAANFKGPVAFYTPATWSRISRRHAPAVGRGLDARPGLVTGGAIEVNTVPRFVGRDRQGAVYSRIPRLQFPADGEGRTVLIENLTQYSKEALYDPVKSWLAGGAPASGRFDEKGAIVPPCKAHPLALRQGEQNLPVRGCESWVETCAFDGTTFGLRWNRSVLEPWTGGLRRGAFPEYFETRGKEVAAVSADAVPRGTGLQAAKFPLAASDESYTSADAKVGPFEAKLADGSVVRFAWYRFVDQPALEDADLGAAEKVRLQKIVEEIHRRWTPNLDYLPPPRTGKLAALDPAILVRPPHGLEVGYVPIAVRQSPR